MADFVAVLRKTLDGLGETTPEVRARVYEKARSTVMSKLAAINPPPPPAVADRQRRALEEAIKSVESEYAPAKPVFDDPLEELESVFAALKEGKPLASSKPAAAKPAATAVAAPPASLGAAQAKPTPAAPKAMPPAASLERAGSSPSSTPARANAMDSPPAKANSGMPSARTAPLQAASPARREPAPLRDSEFLDTPLTMADDAEMDEAAQAEEAAYPEYQEPRRSRSYGPLVAALVAVLVVGGAGYGVWLNRDAFGKMLDVGSLVAKLGKSDTDKPSTSEAAQQSDTASSGNGQTQAAANNQAEPEQQKFTQRLNADGTETDPGPGGTQQAFGEGTSVASLTQAAGQPQIAPPVSAPAPAQSGADAAAPAQSGGDAAAPAASTDAPATDNAAGTPPADGSAATPPADAATAAPAADAQTPPAQAATQPDAASATQPPADTAATDTPAATTTTPPPVAADAQPAPSQTASAEGAANQQVAVGQRAIFYEERTNSAQGSAEPGSIVWSEVKESPGGDLPPEPAIRAEATIPGKDIQLRMTIRRNADKTLPASHIIEMIFLTPEGFDGGGVDNVLRVALKTSEQDAGNPLVGIPAKIADGFFLLALNDSKNEIDTNLGLLKQRSWIDIPIVYKNGRRALITMEKGIPGEKVFDDTLKSWEQPNTAG